LGVVFPLFPLNKGGFKGVVARLKTPCPESFVLPLIKGE